MRQPHGTLTPAAVRRVARDALQPALPWKPFGRRVTVPGLLDLLLPVAALGSSPAAVVGRGRFGFSHETARQAAQADLPGQGERTAGLVDAPRRCGGRRWR